MTDHSFRPAAAVVAIGLALGLAGCTTDISHRGYQPRASDMQQLRIGMAKSEVEGVLGSPSTTATVNLAGDSYYYISSTVEQKAFLNPEETDRKVLAVRFNQYDQVESFANYGLEDGRIVNMNTRETPSRGRELTVLQQLFGNIGNMSPGGPVNPGSGRVGS